MTPPLLSETKATTHMVRRFRFLILAACAVLVAAYFGMGKLLENRITLVNRTTQTVEWIEITVCGRTNRFEDLPPGEAASAPFVAEHDDSFLLRGELADGTVIQARTGYVTNGMFAERRTFTITPDGQVQYK